MNSLQRILFVIDHHSHNESALQQAIQLAKSHSAKLCVVDVVEESLEQINTPPGGLSAEALLQTIIEQRQFQLQQQLDQLAAQQPIDAKVLCGIPYIEIIRQVMKENYQMVIKTAGHKPCLKEAIFGSLDLHLLRKCPVPVWLIKSNNQQPPKNILAAVDISYDSASSPDKLNQQILNHAIELANTHHSQLHLAHAWLAVGEETLLSSRVKYSHNQILDYISHEQQFHQQWLQQLSQYLPVRKIKNPVQLHVEKGVASEVIPKLVDQLSIDLLVMGTVARVGIPGFIMGNTAEEIINSINCSLLTVKPKGFISPVTLSEA